MSLLSIRDLKTNIGQYAVLHGVTFDVPEGQRIGLLGRNGAGKSTFLKILAGSVEPDHGTVLLAPGTRVASLQQDVPEGLDGTVREVVSQGVDPSTLSHDADSSWELDHRVDQILTRMQLDADAPVSSMSSGMKRRVLLAMALVDEPDLLLLDEPTNHLDIDAIRWLEDFLERWNKAFVFITHDRQFLRKLADRILEIDGGRLFDWTCDYDTFLKRKEQALASQEKADALFDKKLAEEEAWIRQGIKARRTRNEGRVRALKALRRERSDRPAKIGTTNLQIQDSSQSGNVVLRASGISFSYASDDGTVLPIVTDFSTLLMRGDKVGLVGPNGVGKSTLLKLLLGELQPESGNVKLGANLQIAYFDQLRQQLDPERTVEQDVADGYQTIKIGDNSRHVLGYLQDFLFTPERARTQIKHLSGGERNRILLAKLFAKPANVVVLDEPTNDLDAETLEMLESRLVDFEGTLLVVSHDREFLNNVVTSTIVFEPHEGAYDVREYVGGYDDWLRQFQNRSAKVAKQQAASTQSISKQRASTSSSSAASKPKPRNRLSFKEQKELDALPDQISMLEKQIAAIHEKMGEPTFYQQPGDQLAAVNQELSDAEKQLEQSYGRWEELESRQG